MCNRLFSQRSISFISDQEERILLCALHKMKYVKYLFFSHRIRLSNECNSRQKIES
jgi:hypothetical protein